MNSSPLVSIIAVCYNQDKWVLQTLDSIALQTYPSIQLIIADDGSTDNSKKIITEWIEKNRPETVFINHEKNTGLTKNINSATPFVKGNYFQVFGCDDIMLPGKIEKQVALLELNRNIDIIYSDMKMIDADSNNMNDSYYQKHIYKKPLSGNIYTDLIERFIIAAPSVLIRRNVLEELKNYNESLDYEDHDFFLRAAKHHLFLFIPENTVLYRVSGVSISTGKVNNITFLKNCFLIYSQNFDKEKEYRKKFSVKLLFYTRNLYSLKFKYAACYFFKAFKKTGDFKFLKYSVASIPFYFKKVNSENE